MNIITKEDNWQLVERDGVSYYVYAKFVDGSWTSHIECRSCPEGDYKDESFPHDTAEQAIAGAIHKSCFHHDKTHNPKQEK
jgi:hypothetical protein